MVGSGLRVFDIRNPHRPREVAYFNAPIEGGRQDYPFALASPAFVPERREVWYADANSGFFVVRLTEAAWLSAPSTIPARATSHAVDPAPPIAAGASCRRGAGRSLGVSRQFSSPSSCSAVPSENADRADSPATAATGRLFSFPAVRGGGWRDRLADTPPTLADQLGQGASVKARSPAEPRCRCKRRRSAVEGWDRCRLVPQAPIRPAPVLLTRPDHAGQFARCRDLLLDETSVAAIADCEDVTRQDPAVLWQAEVMARIADALGACHPRRAFASSDPSMAVVLAASEIFAVAGIEGAGRTFATPAEVDALVVRLFDQEGRSLVRLVRLLVDDRNAAEDLVQEAFIRLARSAGRIEVEAKAPAYLRSIALNLARDHNRRGLVSLRHHLPFDDRRASAEDEVALRDDQREVIEHLRDLPHRQRDCLVLRYYEELGIDEIAATLGISPNSVKTHLKRALAAMATRLGIERAQAGLEEVDA